MKNVEKERIRNLSNRLYEASSHIRILSHVSWAPSVRERFFASGAKELPEVVYPAFDASKVLAIISDVRNQLRSSPIDKWLARQADSMEQSALLLSSCGKPEFFTHSAKLYGTPTTELPDQLNTSLGLATQFDSLTGSFGNIDLGEPPEACHLAQTVADAMQTAVTTMFGDEAPSVQVVDDLSANALAGPGRIRIRRTACFTDKDIDQLIQHEAYVHVATSLNGIAQTDLKILAAGHPGTTKTQEGLAVFAEFISGSIDIDRMRRLADRVIAIQMAIEGADFLDVYRFYLEKIGIKEQAFENARRVFRGGVLTGGAPFTKDNVYLDGLLRVHHFLRSIVSTGRVDCLRLLFCGKLDIEDIPVLHSLTEIGLCRKPKYLPPWAKDLRFLVCYLGYSAFLNRVDFRNTKKHYDELLHDIPNKR